MSTSGTFLAPGQRYRTPAAPPWKADQQLTVSGVDFDVNGQPRVRFRGFDGVMRIEAAATMEAAIRGGELVAVEDFMVPRRQC